VLLSTSDSGLVRFRSEELIIPARQSSAGFEFGTAATQIATAVSITVVVNAPTRPQNTQTLSLVPALLRRVSLAGSSLNGTLGNTLNVTAELKAPAPPGGIELYLGPYHLPNGGGKPKTNPPPLSNPRVQAGTKTITFPIRYEDILRTFSATSAQSTDFDVNFETQNRRVEQVVALDPQTDSKVWTTVPDRALKVAFDIIPLKVSSITVQPNSAASGAEALATFVLNFSPGNERVFLSPTSGSGGARVALAGSSCQQAAQASFVEMVLPPGVTTHTFKVCARTVTSTVTTNIRVGMRSGSFQTTFTTTP
jgi:hypothetical protein